MKIKHAMIVAASVALFSSANAATFVVSNVVDGLSETLYQNGNGTLNSGGIATIGYFTSGYTITGVAATDLAAFTIVTSAEIGGASVDLGGAFAGYAQSDAVDVGTITTGNVLLNRPVYSFIGNLATLASSNAWILIQVGTITDDVPTANDYSSNPAANLPVAGYGQVGPGFTGNAGGQGSSTYSTLQFIPEPSAALLGAFGVLGLLRRRRI
jgi:hypothetical protein